MQKAYGKTPSELETLVEGFSWALADYTMQNIIKAMREYVLNNSDIPAPSDIIKIIKDHEKKDNADDIGITSETLRRYKAKGIPLSSAQQKRLDREDEMAGMNERGPFFE